MSSKRLDRAWNLPDGWFSEPARKWFGPAWKSRLCDPEDKLYMSRTGTLMSQATTANREKGLLEGRESATGYAGKLSAKESKIDISRVSDRLVVGVKRGHERPKGKTR